MQQNTFTKQPFVRLAFVLIAGIIIQHLFNCSISYIYWFGGLLCCVYLPSIFIKNRYRNTPWLGLTLTLMFIVIGMYSYKTHNKLLKLNLINKQVCLAKVLEVPKHKNNTYKSELLVTAIKSGKNWSRQEIKLIAYFQIDSSITNLQAGQLIVFISELNHVLSKRNPFDFDYKKYLNRKNIDYTTYIKSKQWQIINEQTKGIKQVALNYRQKLIALYKNAGLEGEQLAVFSALTLGYKNLLDNNLKSSYSGAGAIHVLAVSGLHVGIVMYVFKFIFGFFGSIKRKYRLKYILIIIGLWMYALITGMSISVCRSALMFSFVLLGNALNKRLSIYNSLAASAFVLLLINPNYLFEIGFQLSYVAVLGIVCLHPYINRWFYSRFWLLRQMWSLTAASLAAQVATFPITVYYFHMFPIYFWLSNFVVIVGALLFVSSTFLLLLLSHFHSIFYAFGSTLNYLVKQLNQFIYWVNDLPSATITGIGFSKVQVFLFYILILCFTFWLLSQKYKILISSLSTLFVIVLSYAFVHDTNKVVCIYHVPNATAIQAINNNYSDWLISSSDKVDMRFVNLANLYWRTSENTINTLDNDNLLCTKKCLLNHNFIGLMNYRGLIINEKISKNQLKSKNSIALDFILIRGNTNIRLSDIPKNIHCNAIVVDGSVPVWKAKDWENSENVCVYETKEKGAFILAEN